MATSIDLDRAIDLEQQRIARKEARRPRNGRIGKAAYDHVDKVDDARDNVCMHVHLGRVVVDCVEEEVKGGGGGDNERAPPPMVHLKKE